MTLQKYITKVHISSTQIYHIATNLDFFVVH